MKTTKKIFKYAFMVLFVVLASCSAEDGADGDTGPQGPAGMDGVDGTNGTDGQDGQDGQDGNANVQNLTFDISTVSGSSYTQAVPELTQEVLDNDLVYAFVQVGSLTYPIPNILNPAGTPFFIRTFMQAGTFQLRFGLATDNSAYDLPAGTLEQLRIVIVESTASKSAGETENELEAQGVDVTNYESLRAHFNLVR